jgi:hypothetical protein
VLLLNPAAQTWRGRWRTIREALGKLTGVENHLCVMAVADAAALGYRKDTIGHPPRSIIFCGDNYVYQ